MPVTLHRPHLPRCPRCTEPVTVVADGCRLCGADLLPLPSHRVALRGAERAAVAIAVAAVVGVIACVAAGLLGGGG